MKNPNGYGSVIKLSGNRRKPFAVRITNGWTDKGKQIYKYVSYHETRAKAMMALSDYNKNPYDVDASKITMRELHEKWYNASCFEKDENHPTGMSKSTIASYNQAWKLCGSITDMKVVDIKLYHIQQIADNSGKKYSSLNHYKYLLNSMFDYAKINELIPYDKDFVKYLDIKKFGIPKQEKKPFDDTEINKLWSINHENIGIVLILIYTGVRISELLDLKKEHVNIDEQYFTVKQSKTKSGRRIVPIADKILIFFKYWMNNSNCEYLISSDKNKKIQYRNFLKYYWEPVMNELDMTHTPHETRHTCITLLTLAKVDARFINRIVGHKGSGIAENVYTHLDIKTLLNEINKI